MFLGGGLSSAVVCDGEEGTSGPDSVCVSPKKVSGTLLSLVQSLSVPKNCGVSPLGCFQTKFLNE